MRDIQAILLLSLASVRVLAKPTVIISVEGQGIKLVKRPEGTGIDPRQVVIPMDPPAARPEDRQVTFTVAGFKDPLQYEVRVKLTLDPQGDGSAQFYLRGADRAGGDPQNYLWPCGHVPNPLVTQPLSDENAVRLVCGSMRIPGKEVLPYDAKCQK